MAKKTAIFFLMVVIMTAIFLSRSFAESVSLDGQFGDWDDKPGLEAPPDIKGDDAIRIVKWFPDLEKGMLYFYAERPNRNDKRYKYSDWTFEVYIEGGLGTRKASLRYHPSSRFVDVELFNQKNKWLWGEKGKWGEWHDSGTAIEFRIPFRFIADNTNAGYQVQVYLESADNRLPETGSIFISTVSSYPVATVAGAFLATGALALYAGRRKKIQE